MELGEEVSYAFVADVVKVGVEQWNHCLQELFQKIEEPQFVLGLVDQRTQKKGEKEIEEAVEGIRKTFQETLKPISLKMTDGSLMIPICNYIYNLLCCFFSSIIPYNNLM